VTRRPPVHISTLGVIANVIRGEFDGIATVDDLAEF
jgi:hypothetical protein